FRPRAGGGEDLIRFVAQLLEWLGKPQPWQRWRGDRRRARHRLDRLLPWLDVEDARQRFCKLGIGIAASQGLPPMPDRRFAGRAHTGNVSLHKSSLKHAP